MILAKSAIRQAVFDGRIKILDDEGEPFPGWERVTELRRIFNGNGFTNGDPEALQPASIDLSLGRHWLVPKPNRDINGLMVMDSRLPVEYDECFVDEIIVPAKGFILARTREQVFVDKSISAWVEGRSSFGRFGTFVQNAGWVDPGFQGTITLEIFNALDVPAILYAGTPCCQLVIPEVTGDTEEGYTGQYQGQIATKGSGLWKSVPKGAL